MNISPRYIPLLSAVVLLFSTGPAVALDIYVDAQEGNDANPGTPEQPFRTITAAVASIGDATGISVRIAAGIYDATLGETFPMTVPSLAALSGASATDTVIGGVPQSGARQEQFVLGHKSTLEDIGLDHVYIESKGRILMRRVHVDVGNVRTMGREDRLVDCVIANSPSSAIDGCVALERVHIINAEECGVGCTWGTSTMRDCLVENVQSIGIGGDSALIEDSRFVYRGEYPATFGVSSDNARLVNCLFEGIGLQVKSLNCEVHRCVFTKGGARRGGLELREIPESPTHKGTIKCIVTNSLFVDTEISFRYAAELRLINCTITGNANPFFTQGLGLKAVNCVITGVNQRPGNVDYCLLDSPLAGKGNIVADPMFVNPQNGDYHLQRGSPAIDSGTPVITVTDDFDGARRPQGSGFDMGAYEFVADTGVSDWAVR
ncbi:MAG: DUF1565 domain-containing protein [bacterium]